MATIDFDISCVGCKTNLHGCDPRRGCPQCSWPIADTLTMSLVDPTDLSVNGDVSCVNCGYNLRTLSADALCPECGKPVAPSLSADPLRHASRDWLKMMAKATNILAAVAVVHIIFNTLSFLAYPMQWISFTILGWPRYVGLQLCAVLWCVGVFLLTRREDRPGSWASGGWLGRCARGAAVGALVCYLGGYLYMLVDAWVETGQLMFWPGGGAGLPGLARIVFRVLLASLSTVMYAAGWVLLLVYLRQIGRRAGRKTGPITFVIGFFVLDGMLQLIQYGPVYFLYMCKMSGVWPGTRWGPTRQTVWDAGFFVVPLVFLALMVPTFVVLRRYGKMFKAAALGRSDRHD